MTKTNCQFCELIAGKIESYIVFEDDISLAFLDSRPLFSGHCLLVPKNHYETLVDLPASLIAPIFCAAQLLALVVEKGLKSEGTFVAINNRVSQSVPHLHIHVVPRRRKDGLKGFFWPRRPYKDREAIVKIQNILRDSITQFQTKKNEDRPRHKITT